MANFEWKYSTFNTQFSMKKIVLIAGCSFFILSSFAQTITQQLQKAFQQFEADPQLKHAISSLYVIDAATGKVVFGKNSQIGLAPASTQKIITAATAFELLGKDYRYKTDFANKKSAIYNLYVVPNGDPTFGSLRWSNTNIDSILNRLVISLNSKNISRINNVFIDNSGWDFENIPDGWIWQDIGNYYGVGAYKLNYRENQYDVILKSGKSVGDSVTIVTIEPEETSYLRGRIETKLVSAAKGSGDNSYMYLPLGIDNKYRFRGTIPINESNFHVSAASTEPEFVFLTPLMYRLQSEKNFNIGHGTADIINVSSEEKKDYTILYTHYSPTLDSIIYWFLQKSINLYGEALIKTFAYEKDGFGSTEAGVKIVKDFWKQKGIDEDELNIGDGSGLSPQNRVTTHAQVEILKYAKRQSWFPYFYEALPEYNGMKMKSGTIKDVKGFCGYHKAANGKEYIFSFLINNYNGPTSNLIGKMYRVLNMLK